MTNITKQMTTLLLCAGLLVASCHTPENLLVSPADNPAYSIINGDTVKTVANFDKTLKGQFYHDQNLISVGDTILTYKEPKLHTPPAKDPDLSAIKNNTHPDLKGKPLQMIAIGGSMTAGVRDGGYFNEGMLTSYANLVALQMKVKKFELPLFDKQEYSGTIRRVKTGFNPTGGPTPKYNIVKNNSGSNNNGNAFGTKKYVGDPDNLASPYYSRYYLKGWVGTGNPEQGSALRRIITQVTNNSLMDKIASKKFDFFILESGFDDAFALTTKFSSGLGSYEDFTFIDNLTFDQQSRIAPELDLIRKVMIPLNAKGVILNVPDLLDLPCFIKTDVVKNYVLNDPYLKDDYGNYRFSFDDIAAFKPSGKIDSLMSPKVHYSLKPKTTSLKGGDFLSTSYDMLRIINGSKSLNNQFQNHSKRYGYPIVDIQSLYKKVANGGFLTDDGSMATVDNFYSNDRINPSAFGQAVIANEVIKVINSGYKMSIPLIPTKTYLEIK